MRGALGPWAVVQTSFLEYLADPKTKEPLELIATKRKGDLVLEGRLVSPHGSYPIVRGVPRFVECGDLPDYTRSFAFQWGRWARTQFESANVGRPMQGHTLRMWERITATNSADLGGAVIGDFGCGSGRFVEVVRRKNGRVIALEMSSAVEVAREIFDGDPDVLLCQADVLRAPIRPGSLDGAFSIGVLHHTPDPRSGLSEMTQAVRAGGWVAMSVYGKGGYYDWPTVRFWRRVFKVLVPLLGHRPALAYAYFATYLLGPLSRIPVLGLALRALLPFVRLPDREWALLDTFDSVTPVYQSAHESYEVYTWFRTLGLSEIVPSNWGFTAYHGVKR